MRDFTKNISFKIAQLLTTALLKSVEVLHYIPWHKWYGINDKHIFAAGHLGHSDSITSIDCHTDNTLVLTGSTDLTAKLININTGKVS